MDEILEKYSDYIVKERRYSLKTCRAYCDDVISFFKFVNKEEVFLIEEIDYSVIRSWIIFLSESGYSNLSINRKVSSLKSFFKFLYQTKVISVYPLSGHKSLKVEKKLQVPFSLNEMEVVLSDLDESEYEGLLGLVVVTLFYCLGIRKAELINLKLTDVDFFSNAIKVLGKRNKQRILPLVTDVVVLLKKYLKKRDLIDVSRSDYLILLKNGNKLNETFVYRLINGYFRGVTSKSKKSPHMLRHTFATHMLNNGADLNSIKELLGHSSLLSTQVYTQVSLVELQKVYKESHPRFRDYEV